jgi:hypothetical protein
MDHLQNRLVGIDDILKTVSMDDIEQLEKQIILIRQEIDNKKKLLSTTSAEKKEVLHLLENYERFRAPLNIRYIY